MRRSDWEYMVTVEGGYGGDPSEERRIGSGERNYEQQSLPEG